MTKTISARRTSRGRWADGEACWIEDWEKEEGEEILKER